MGQIKQLSLFSGIGAFEKGFQRVDPSIETVAYCEIDTHASKSYDAIHWAQGAPNLVDVCDVNGVDYLDVAYLTHGSPCQDFSVAGHGKGGERESGTRSSLMWETVRVVLEAFPRAVLWENVPNVVSKKHKPIFDQYLDALAPHYNNYYQIINAKDQSIPQNRKRIFVVSIRKDIDDGAFEFPESVPLDLRLRDLLEENVPSKYYLSKEQIDRLVFKPNFEKPMRGELGVVQDTNQSAYTGAGEIVGTLRVGGDTPHINEQVVMGNVNPSGRGQGGNVHTGNVNPSGRGQGGNVHTGNVNPSGRGQGGNVHTGDIAPTLTTNKGEGVKVALEQIGSIDGSISQGMRVYTDEMGVTLSAQGGVTLSAQGGVTLSAQGGGMGAKTGLYAVEVEQTVRVKKYKMTKVERQAFVEMLNTKKTSSGETNSTLATLLGVPVTQVEQYFRRDVAGFALPSDTVWPSLKWFLGIETQEYDKYITEWEEKKGSYEQAGRVYLDKGVSPTLTTGQKVSVAQPLQLINATKAGHLPAQDGDGVVLNFIPGARGRVQEQTSPTLTTADMAGVVEVRPIINPGKPEVYQNGRRMKQNDEPSFTITTVDRHGVVLIGGTQYAIRKLTPLEGWRLMDFDDSDFMAARLMGVSDTQLYKQAGNSIVVSVVEAIARNLHPIIARSYQQ